MIIVTKKIAFTTRARRKCIIDADVAARRPRATKRPPRIPRVARLMALAIHFEDLLRKGVVADQSDLAHYARVTQPRMTQIMNLNHLAPDIQEDLLFLEGTPRGRERIHERALRQIIAPCHWEKQRILWTQLKQRS